MLDIYNLKILPFVPLPLPHWMPKERVVINPMEYRDFIIHELPRVSKMPWNDDPKDYKMDIIEHRFEKWKSTGGKWYYINKEGWILSDIGLFFGVSNILTTEDIESYKYRYEYAKRRVRS